MMGVLGVVGHAGRPVGMADLRPGLAAMVRRGSAEVYASADGKAVFVRLLRDGDATPPSITVVEMPVVVDGRLYNRAELLAQLDPGLRATAATDDAALVRALYRVFGPEAFARLRGQYALALYDPHAATLHFASDVVGLRSLAYRADPEATFFASEQKSVLAMSGAKFEPNDAALAELLLGYPTGALAGGQGLFKHVDVLGRGEHVALGHGAPVRSRVQEFDLRPHGPRAYVELCAEFRSLFRQAVARGLDPHGTTAITVSGGLDSSSIYCVAKALQAEGAGTGRIVGINFTTEDGGPADERVYTDAISRQCGPGILRVPMQPDGFLASLPETIRASESPQVNPAGNLFQRQYAMAAEEGATTFVTGFWGDEVFSPFNYWHHLLWSLRLPTLLKVAREHHRWITETPSTAWDTLGWVLRATFKEFSPLWMQRVVRSLKRSSVPPHPLAAGRLAAYGRARRSAPLAWRPATRFAQWQRDLLDFPHTRHFLRAFDQEVAAYDMRAAHPFLDPDLVQFLLRCDGSQINPQGRYKGLMRDALRQEVPAVVLDRRDKGDFTDAYRAGHLRDLGAALHSKRWGAALKSAEYVRECSPEWVDVCLTSNSDNVHITAQSADCVGLGHWLNLFYDRGFEDDVERYAAHGAGRQQAGLRNAGPDDLR